MKEILITTESGSDVPAELVEKYDIHVIPMHVIIDGKSYDDGKFPIDQIYDYYEQTKRVPSTSAVNIQEYWDFFDDLKEKHPDCVIYHFAYSSVASSTYASCHTALEQKNYDNVYLIDTKSVSGGCTAHIVESAKMIRRFQKNAAETLGMAADQAKEAYSVLAEKLQGLADKICCHFIPGTLDYLRAGGRVSNAQYLGATLLRLKPLIEITEDGHLITTKKFRGSMYKIVDKFMENFFEQYNLAKDCLYLMYSKGLSQESLDKMKEIAVKAGFKETHYVMTGCTITCHGGQGAIGLAGVLK